MTFEPIFKSRINEYDVEIVKVTPAGMEEWLNGYVQLPPDHPWFKLHYDNIPATVHGGLTFSENGKIGFDCAHAGDTLKKCNFRYVLENIVDLIKQAEAAVTSKAVTVN